MFPPAASDIRTTCLFDRFGDTAIGGYLEDQERILVLDYHAFRRSEKWFGVPVSPFMYRSVVTHEVAHAVADCGFKMPNPTIQAKEYVAYVAMFATMESTLRKRILMENPRSGFDSELKINATIYLCDPMRFGVEAYRHFLQEDHGKAFLLKVLSGGALSEWSR